MMVVRNVDRRFGNCEQESILFCPMFARCMVHVPWWASEDRTMNVCKMYGTMMGYWRSYHVCKMYGTMMGYSRSYHECLQDVWYHDGLLKIIPWMFARCMLPWWATEDRTMNVCKMCGTMMGLWRSYHECLQDVWYHDGLLKIVPCLQDVWYHDGLLKIVPWMFARCMVPWWATQDRTMNVCKMYVTMMGYWRSYHECLQDVWYHDGLLKIVPCLQDISWYHDGLLKIVPWMFARCMVPWWATEDHTMNVCKMYGTMMGYSRSYHEKVLMAWHTFIQGVFEIALI